MSYTRVQLVLTERGRERPTIANDILQLLAQGAVFLVSDDMVIPSGVARIDKKTVKPPFDLHVDYRTITDRDINDDHPNY